MTPMQYIHDILICIVGADKAKQRRRYVEFCDTSETLHCSRNMQKTIHIFFVKLSFLLYMFNCSKAVDSQFHLRSVSVISR